MLRVVEAAARRCQGVQMLTARIICIAVIVIMGVEFATAISATGIHQGLGTDVFMSGSAANSWQSGIDTDLVMGLILMVSWILWRESSLVNGLVWAFTVLYWGNIVVAVYLLLQLNRSKGRWDFVLLGYHASGRSSESPRRPWPLSVKMALYLVAVVIGIYVVRASLAVNFAFAPTVGYIGGLGCFVAILLRSAYAGRRT